MCLEVQVTCKLPPPQVLACHLLVPSLSTSAALRGAVYRSWPQLQGHAPMQQCLRLQPKLVWPLSPSAGICQPRLSQQQDSGCFRVLASRSHQFLFSVLFSENPRPGSVHIFSTIPQAAPDHRQNGARTYSFLQQHNWRLK